MSTLSHDARGTTQALLRIRRHNPQHISRGATTNDFLHGSHDERGQVLVIGLIMAIGLVMVSITVANVGMMVAEKIHLQDTVDAAAYSAAVTEARYMNLSAYINRAMVANYNSMAFNTALWSVFDADDHGIAATTDLLYKISEVLGVIPLTTAIGQAIDVVADGLAAVHDVLHTLNSTFNDLFAQDEQDLNQYLEVYNVYALTMYQGLLYASLQADRFRVVRSVAQEMDPEVITTTTLGMGAEAVSYDELAQAVDWVINDTEARSAVFNQFNRSFNAMFGEDDNTSDHSVMLAAVTEASLDPFTAGRNRKGEADLLRQFNSNNLLSALKIGDFDLTDLIELPFEVPCITACVPACTAACSKELFSSPSEIDDCIADCPRDCVDYCEVTMELRLGASMRDGQESKASQTHVPKIARKRMRETNFFGFDFIFESKNPLFKFAIQALKFLGLTTGMGHTSGDRHADVANSVNGILSPLIGMNIERAIECMLTGTGCQLTVSTPSSGYNAQNMKASTSMLPTPLLPGPPLFADDHWDGAGDVQPIRSHEFFDPVQGKLDPPQYLAQVIEDGLEEGVPMYDWIVDLDDVGIPHYHYPSEGAQERPDGNSRGGGERALLTGPSVAVVGIKRARDINGLRGLGIGLEEPNDYPLTAIARAQVYYLRNPNRPEETPSLFNPHWVARLAPIDAEDSPGLLREILPFVSGFGIPIDPTH